jgi:hypothetical protein
MYERSALILDTEDRRLAQASSSLIVLGHRPLYADDLDELALMAEQRRAEVGALLLPASRARVVAALRKRIIDRSGSRRRRYCRGRAARDCGRGGAALRRSALGAARAVLALGSSLRRLARALGTDERGAQLLRCPVRFPWKWNRRSGTPAQLTDLAGRRSCSSPPPPRNTPIALRGTLFGRPFACPRACAGAADPIRRPGAIAAWESRSKRSTPSRSLVRQQVGQLVASGSPRRAPRRYLGDSFRSTSDRRSATPLERPHRPG